MTVEACLGRTIEGIDWIPAGLGRRRFARGHLAGDSAPVSVIARVEAPEDPAGRPPGLPPEPPLEPLRALLERSGLPVPRSYGGELDGGVWLLEDLGSSALEDAARSASSAERRALYSEACDLVPRLQNVLEADAKTLQDDNQVVHDPARLGFDARWKGLAVVVRVRGHLTGEENPAVALHRVAEGGDRGWGVAQAMEQWRGHCRDSYGLIE